MIYGRDREMESLTRMFTDCVRGHGRVAVVTGGVASGKTALLRNFSQFAAASGAVHLGASGLSAERGVPFGVMRQLLGAASLGPDDSAQFDRLPTAARAGGPEQEGDGDAGGQPPSALGRDLAAILIRISVQQPIVITVDDIQD
ncbi:MAG TPA: ATP-binding protein, partial [Pseudonocardia sp.]|nr:ATP-binding protein [Pseudonocardia sp.]